MAEVAKSYLCQRCGNCCRWPGFVRLGHGEAERIAEHLGMAPADFVARFTHLHPDRAALMLQSRTNGECVFLDGRNTCTIQAVKPRQCAGFPNAWNFPGWREVCEAIEITSPRASRAS
jgi:Fe-S-cluster containining protein